MRDKKDIDLETKLDKLTLELIDLNNNCLDVCRFTVNRCKRITTIIIVYLIIVHIIFFASLTYFLTHVEIEAGYKESTQEIKIDKDFMGQVEVKQNEYNQQN